MGISFSMYWLSQLFGNDDIQNSLPISDLGKVSYRRLASHSSTVPTAWPEVKPSRELLETNHWRYKPRAQSQVPQRLRTGCVHH